jgi:alanyl-tRNA synthetase
VDDNLLRFDFQADKILTNQEISNIEKNINDLINKALPVLNQEMSIEDAQKT